MSKPRTRAKTTIQRPNQTSTVLKTNIILQFLQKTEAIITDEGDEEGDEEGGEEGLSLLKRMISLYDRGTERGRTCRQAVLKCEVEACGKAPLYYYSKETPVWRMGGVPWAAGVYVGGRYRCGGTLVRPRWVVTSATCMANVR